MAFLFTGGSCHRSPATNTFILPKGLRSRPSLANGCRAHARRRYESSRPSNVKEQVVTSSMTMKRHVRTFRNRTSMSPSLAFRLLLSKAVCMLTGMHPLHVQFSLQRGLPSCSVLPGTGSACRPPSPVRSQRTTAVGEYMCSSPSRGCRGDLPEEVSTCFFSPARGARVLLFRTVSYALSSCRNSLSSV